MSVDASGLFALGRQTLQALRDELAGCGITLDAGLELRPGDGLLCCYSLHDRQIYLSAPDPAGPSGRFVLMLFRLAMQLDSDQEILRFLTLLIPWLVAHEVGHHLRHRAGLFGADAWAEEQIASGLATLFIKRRLASDEKQALLDFLARAMAGLEQGLGDSAARDGAGGLGRAEAGPTSAGVAPTGELIRYFLTHMQWLHQGLLAQDGQSLEEFAEVYLSRTLSVR